MTVEELSRLLGQYPPGRRVVVNGYEEGYDDLSPEQFSVVKISLNTGANPWEGQVSTANGWGLGVSAPTTDQGEPCHSS